MRVIGFGFIPNIRKIDNKVEEEERKKNWCDNIFFSGWAGIRTLASYVDVVLALVEPRFHARLRTNQIPFPKSTGIL